MRRFIAIVAGLIAPGAGHFAMGRYGRGWIWWLTVVGLTAALPVTRFVGVVLIVLARIVSVIDVIRAWPASESLPRWRRVIAAWVVLFVIASSCGFKPSPFRRER